MSTLLAGYFGCCPLASPWRLTSPSMGSGNLRDLNAIYLRPLMPSRRRRLRPPRMAVPRGGNRPGPGPIRPARPPLHPGGPAASVPSAPVRPNPYRAEPPTDGLPPSRLMVPAIRPAVGAGRRSDGDRGAICATSRFFRSIHRLPHDNGHGTAGHSTLPRRAGRRKRPPDRRPTTPEVPPRADDAGRTRPAAVDNGRRLTPRISGPRSGSARSPR